MSSSRRLSDIHPPSPPTPIPSYRNTPSMPHLPRSSFSSSSSSSGFTSTNAPTLSSPHPDNPTTQSLSTAHLCRLRSPSETSLRFPPRHQQPSPYSTTLARLLLAPVPLTPSPSLFLSCFPPAANIFNSLLALLAKHSLPHSLHNILTTVAVHPHLHQLPHLPPKDAVAVDFVRAVAESPPRIPVELRTAFRSMHHADRAQHIALLASFAAYYSLIAGLLGMTDPSADSSHAPFDDTEITAFTEPSEMSAPSSTSHSRTSSARSLPKRLSTAKNHFLDRVAHPLRLKLARHATHHLERSTWLADIPTTRRSQDDFIRAAMGFTPEYLHSMRNTTQRAAFIYLIDELLLRDSACGISTSVKNLCCYILARSAENSVLTAHSIFLANRFGADDKQLSACTDVDLLQAMQDIIASHDLPSNADSSSSFTSSDDDIVAPPARSPPVRRRRRADRFRYSEFAVGVVIDESNSECGGDDSDAEQELNDEFGDPIQAFRNDQPDTFSANLQKVSSSSNRRSAKRETKGLKRRQRRNQSKEDGECASGTASPINGKEYLVSTANEASHQPFFAIPEDPEVPDVDGLNSICANDFEQFRQEEFNDEGVSTMPSTRQLSRGPDDFEEEDENIDMDLFSPKEVSFLLLAHQVAQASRRNSRVCTKYAGATPGSLVMPDLAAVIHSQFDSESIMEMISVIGAFNFLLRWTVCYPYRPGALEAPVRRFVQTPIAHDLCIDSVGQRTNSKHGFNLRIQTGRSFKLPRHAVVPRV